MLALTTLATLALGISHPLPQATSTDLLPSEDVVPLLGWTLEQTREPLDILAKSVELFEMNITAEPGTDEAQLIQEQLYQYKSEYEALLEATFVDSNGSLLQPLLTGLARYGELGSPALATYAGAQVPGLPCVVGVPHLGDWATHFPELLLAGTQVVREFSWTRAKARLTAARLDRELVRLQTREIPFGSSSHEFGTPIAEYCPDAPFAVSLPLGRHLVEARWLGAKRILSLLHELREVVVLYSATEGASLTETELNILFLLHDALVFEIASSLHRPHGRPLFVGDDDIPVAFEVDGEPDWVLQSFGFASNELGLSSLEARLGLFAQLEILDLAIADVAIALFFIEQDLNVLPAG